MGAETLDDVDTDDDVERELDVDTLRKEREIIAICIGMKSLNFSY